MNDGEEDRAASTPDDDLRARCHRQTQGRKLDEQGKKD